MEATGIVRNELAGEQHAAAWTNLLGLDAQKGQLIAWGALTLRSADFDRTATAVNRLAVVQGPPGTGKTTLARNLAFPLGRVCGAAVRVIEFAAHEAMSGEHGRTLRRAELGEHQLRARGVVAAARTLPAAGSSATARRTCRCVRRPPRA